MTESGKCKLGNFGSAILEGENSVERSLDQMIGTPLYLAPEIIKQHTSVIKKNYHDKRKVDIWALGVILYELTTLRLPFLGSDLVELFVTIMNGKYPPLPETYSFKLRNII